MPGSHNPEETARRRMIIGAAALVVALVAAGAIIAYAALGHHTASPQPATFTPAQVTTATPQSGVNSSATVPASESVSVGPSSAGTSTAPSGTWKLGPKIAFRLGMSVFVANEDGSGARAVAQSADVSAYSVSPDGSTVALVSPLGILSVQDLSSGAQLFQSESQKSAPTWSPNSKQLGFTAGLEPAVQAVVVNRDGTGRTQWVGYSAPQFSPDGSRIAAVAEGADKGTLAVISLPSGKPRLLDGTKPQLAFAWAGAQSVAFLSPTSSSATSGTGSYSLSVVGTDGSSAKRYGSWAYDPLATPSELVVSAGHNWAEFAESGDDGYARTWVMPLRAGAARTAVSRRRSTYAYGFSGNGRFLFYFEGNSFQGESSELMRLRLGGAERVPVVSGATP